MKPAKAIRYALQNNVRTFTYDSVDEVRKMAKVAKELGVSCQLLLRLRVDDSHSELPLGDVAPLRFFECKPNV
jgi:diaminopimelate decarboxylase